MRFLWWLVEVLGLLLLLLLLVVFLVIFLVMFWDLVLPKLWEVLQRRLGL